MDRTQTDAIMIVIAVIYATIVSFCFLIHVLAMMTRRYYDRKENQ